MNLTPELAYLVGILVGDGHLYAGNKSSTSTSKDYRISLEMTNKEVLEYSFKIIKNLTLTTTSIKRIKDKRKNRRVRWRFDVRHKALFQFLHFELGLPLGKKSFTVTFPQKFFGDDTLETYFLAGYFDADGGIRGSTIGFTSGSESLIHSVSLLLSRRKITHFIDSWTHSKTLKRYFGIKIYSLQIGSFLKSIPFRDVQKRENALSRGCRSGQTG